MPLKMRMVVTPGSKESRKETRAGGQPRRLPPRSLRHDQRSVRSAEVIALRIEAAGRSRKAASTLRGMTIAESTWSPSSWRSRRAGQQPEWPDAEQAEAVRARLAKLPP